MKKVFSAHPLSRNVVHSLHFLLLLILFFTLNTACTSSPDRKTETGTDAVQQKTFGDTVEVQTKNTYVYQCASGPAFTAYVTEQRSTLFLPDSVVTLPKTVSASGAKYSRASMAYWSKGDEARLEWGGTSYTCNNLPREKSWKAAALRGVDFRALGQEPGWYLEIRENRQLTYIGQYGQDTLQIPDPPPVPQHEEIHYTRHHQGRTLSLKAVKDTCTSMSGLTHPYSITLRVSGKQGKGKPYEGCGRFLHY